MNHKHLYIGVAILLCLASSCKQKNVQGGMDDSAFVFETENIKGDEADYSRPAVPCSVKANISAPPVL